MPNQLLNINIYIVPVVLLLWPSPCCLAGPQRFVQDSAEWTSPPAAAARFSKRRGCIHEKLIISHGAFSRAASSSPPHCSNTKPGSWEAGRTSWRRIRRTHARSSLSLINSPGLSQARRGLCIQASSCAEEGPAAERRMRGTTTVAGSPA